jgi:hypothetical protein
MTHARIWAGLALACLVLTSFPAAAQQAVPAPVSVVAPAPTAGTAVTTTATKTDDSGAVVTTTSTQVVIPWGKWLSDVLAQIEVFVVTVLLPAGLFYLGKKVAPEWAATLKQKRVEDLLTKAVDYSFGVVEGAVKGQQSSVAVANAQLRAAANYAVANAPALATEIGDTLKPKIVARLSAQGALPPEANGNLVGAAVPPAPASVTSKPAQKPEIIEAFKKISPMR